MDDLVFSTAGVVWREERETFSFALDKWDVQAAKRMIARTPRMTASLSMTHDLAALLAFIVTDAAHAATADLSVPLIYAHYPDTDTGMLIDGWHRVRRAFTEKRAALPCVMLTAEESVTCMAKRRRRASR
jgi:hypothetical protein